MSLLSGGFSLTRYRIEPIPGRIDPDEIFGAIRRHGFVDIEATAEQSSVGWVDVSDMFDLDFSRVGPWVGDYIVLGLREDTRQVSGSLVKKYLSLEVRKLIDARRGRPLSPRDRRELKDQVEYGLRERIPPTSRFAAVVWNTRLSEVWLAATGKRWRDVFEDLFTGTFDLFPVIQAPPLAAGSLVSEVSVDDLMDLAPTRLAGIVERGK